MTLITALQKAQQITTQTKQQLPSHATEEQKRIAVEILVKQIGPLFVQWAAKIPIITDAGGLAGSGCSILRPFIAQILPLPKVKSFIQCNKEGETDFRALCLQQLSVEKAVRRRLKIPSKFTDKQLFKMLIEIISCFYPPPLKPQKEGTTPESFAQSCIFCFPLVFPFFVQLFPHLMTMEQTIEQFADLYLKNTDDVVQLEGQLIELCGKLPKTGTAFELLIDKMESVFSSSEEKKKLFYRILAKTCSKHFFCKKSYASFFSATPLLEYFFKRGKSNPLLAVEIAKVAAAENGEATSEHLKAFGIVSEKERIEIARIAVAQDGQGLACFFQNYRITEEKVRIEIAEIAVATSGWGISRYVKNFEIKDTNALFFIFLIALSKDSHALKYLYMYPFPEGYFSPFFAACDHLQEDVFNPGEVLTSLCLLNQGLNRESIEQELGKIGTLSMKREILIWLTHFLGCCALEEVSSEGFSLLVDSGLINACMDYRDPPMRYALTQMMITLATNETAEKCWLTMKEAQFPTHALVPMLLLSSIFADSDSLRDDHVETCKSHFNQICLRTFKEGKNLRVYVNFLNFVLKAEELTLDEKNRLLQYVLNQKELPLTPCMRTVQAIADSGAITQLKQQDLEKILLSDILLKNFQMLIPIKPTQDFGKKFLEHSINARVPHYLTIYAAKIASLKNALFNEWLGVCVQSFIDGDFPKIRYDLNLRLNGCEENPHLRTVFKNRPTLFQEWQKGGSAKVQDLLFKYEPSENIPAPILNAARAKLKKKKTEALVVDTDDFQDLALSGTEVDTCQKVDGDPALTICLINLFLDRKIRLLAIKDKKGRILARSLLRMLDEEPPVLSLGKFYPSVIAPEFQIALKFFAKERANKLGLALTSKGVGQGKQYGKPISSLGSAIPDEYSDDAGGITTGVYSIPHSHILEPAPLNRFLSSEHEEMALGLGEDAGAEAEKH